MSPLDGDAVVLLRAAQRCGALVLELDRLAKVLGAAADSGMARWSGTAATSFGSMAHTHRATVQGARAAVARFGGLASSFAHELADAQLQAKHLPEGASAERKVIEDRISVLRRRFRQQSTQLDSEVRQLLLRRPVEPPRWTGPVRPPAGWRRDWPINPPPRWKGPVRPRPGWPRHARLVQPPRWKGPIHKRVPWRPGTNPVQPLPSSAPQGPGATRLPWAPPWLNGQGGPAATPVQPVGVRV